LGVFSTLSWSKARFLQEARQCGLRCVGLGAFQLLAHILLLGRQTGDGQRETARASERLDAFEQIAAIGQRADHQPFEVTRRTCLHPGGNFFREEFEQQIGHYPNLGL
jgi:hypothetical protein